VRFELIHFFLTNSKFSQIKWLCGQPASDLMREKPPRRRHWSSMAAPELDSSRSLEVNEPPIVRNLEVSSRPNRF
jgi:hypothetical protein